jgi:hypothetical protein
MVGSLLAACAASLVTIGHATPAQAWPSLKYREDPVAFFHDIIGVEPWSKQVEIIEAIRDNPRVAVKSGHKVSKSHTAAGVALWFFSSFEDARVVMSSTTSRQVDQILWREVKMMHARGGRCVACKAADDKRRALHEPLGPRPCAHSALLDGSPMQLARTGIRSPDFREIVGFTAREAEAVAGVSGKNLLYILDEASGIPDVIFEAIEGNRAGGARLVMFSNPTRTEGEFFAAFSDEKKAFYKTVTISSEHTPNVIEGREVIRGLATREWVEEKKLEWGEDSPLYKIRVKGEFVLNEDGKVMSVHAISEAEKRWLEPVEEADELARLQIGLDPAGAGQAGDESVFALRRGKRHLGLLPFRGQSEEALVVHLLGIIKMHGRPRELPPIVKVDREGSIGAKVYGLLRAYADVAEGVRPPFVLVGVRSSERAVREPTVYDRVRDELWANLAQWMREGGAIVEDAKLAKELHAPAWVTIVTGRQKVTSKDDLRKMLGRSPDRADALALAVWDVPSLLHPSEPGAPPEPEDGGPEGNAYDLPGAIDPYAGGGGVYG